jgi:N-acetyl-anhydromuramyl-L-alanine amidase AmpD
MLPNQDGVIVIPNSNCFPGRNGFKPSYVILHGTAGGVSAQAIANFFASTQGGGSPVSSHYVIGQDGTIVQCVAEEDGAWGNGAFSAGHDAFWDESINPNLITISIEHCKPSSDNSDDLTDAQRASSFKLVQGICDRWGIPKRQADANGGITGHFSIDPINRRNCPGVYPWNQLWNALQGEENTVLDLNDPLVSRYFKDGGNGTWKCTNGVVLLGANLTFYRSNGGPALFGLPVSNEIYPPEYPNTAIVPCERALIVYDPGRKIDSAPIPGPCYLLHIDSGIGQRLLLQKGNTTIQKLTSTLAQINTLSKVS